MHLPMKAYQYKLEAPCSSSEWTITHRHETSVVELCLNQASLKQVSEKISNTVLAELRQTTLTQ